MHVLAVCKRQRVLGRVLERVPDQDVFTDQLQVWDRAVGPRVALGGSVLYMPILSGGTAVALATSAQQFDNYLVLDFYI